MKQYDIIEHFMLWQVTWNWQFYENSACLGQNRKIFILRGLSINHRFLGPWANHNMQCTVDFQRNNIGCDFFQRIYTEN